VTTAPLPLAAVVLLALVDRLYAVFGPFVFPVALFALGVVGYVFLRWLVRAGVVGGRRRGRDP
jgi:hypothetical protein